MGVALLAGRTWRDLRLTARAYGLRFNNNWTKDEAFFALRRALLEEGRLRQALKRLDSREREALLALKAHGGRLVRYTFCQSYGAIRRYRPWRDDAPPHPWRRPISMAEKLWFLGLIEVDTHRAVLLPDAVAALLPPVPHPQTVVWDVRVDLDASAVVRDVAALLGTLLYRPVRLLHGRWLPPYTLKAINQRVSLPETLDGVRSEFQCGRTRFLHYLAEIAGLVSVQGGVLLPTVEAWSWLALPYPQAHRRLVEAMRADLGARHPQWQRFRFPPLAPAAWDFLLDLPPGQYQQAALVKQLRLKMLDDAAGDYIQAALDGPLPWLGLAACMDGVVVCPSSAYPATETAQLSLHIDSIGLILPPAPSLTGLVRLLGFASLGENGLWIDRDGMARAVEQKLNATQIAQVLADLTGSPVPPAVLERLRAWEQEAREVQIKRQAVLTVADAETMRAIRADWRLRPFLGEQLSPRHIMVRDEHLLRQRLARRKYVVAQLPDRKADPLPRAGSDDPAYLWLAVRICQGLADLVPPPLAIPGAAAATLEKALGDRVDTLQSLAEQYISQVQAALRGRYDDMPPIQQGEPERIRAAVEGALAQATSVRIRYFSPIAGEETEREIEPQVVYERQGATYVEAWCHRDNAARTFRLDRILAVGVGL